jgi:hypothetical protein
MKKVLLFIALIAFVTNYTFAQGLIISEVVDGTGSGGYPKYVEITNATDASIDLNGYKINKFVNAKTTSTLAYEFTEEFILPAKASVIVTNIDNETDGQLWTDFTLTAPTYAIYGATNVNCNGNDTYELVDASDNRIDIYGTIEDGTGKDWEYLDSYSYRKSAVHNPNATFDVNEWFVAGANVLDDKSADLSPYLTPGTHTLTTSTGTIDLTAPNSGSYQNGDVVHITWTSSDVDSVLLYARMEGNEELFLITEESAILASLGMFDLPIPADAEEGNYKFILKDKDDPSVADSSDNFIFVEDVVFAGLDDEYPFYPENGAVDVPTDLFSGRLKINFQENVQTGTGNIVLKKFSDDSVVETFDVTNAAHVMVSTDDPYTIWIYISSNLDPNTQFYVEVDAGAIKDNAGTPNEFAGFTGNATWTFTTGAFDSFTSIYDIQYTTDPSGDSPHAGEVVKTSGIVMHKYYKSGAYKGFYIQEAAGDWSGIYVYDPDNDDVNIGDEVNVGGTIKEYYGYTQIQDVTFKEVISSSNTLYNPVVVTLAQLIEPYESVLVTVESISCSNPDLGYGEWELTDGTDQSRVDDMFYKYTPVQDEQFTSITGIFVYNYSNFKIEPRDASDIVSAPTRISNVDDAGLVVGPNPVSSEIRISANTSIADVQVINLVGEVMDVETFGAAGRVNVATDGLANGLYLVKVTFTDGTVKTKRIIKR